MCEVFIVDTLTCRLAVVAAEPPRVKRYGHQRTFDVRRKARERAAYGSEQPQWTFPALLQHHAQFCYYAVWQRIQSYSVTPGNVPSHTDVNDIS